MCGREKGRERKVKGTRRKAERKRDEIVGKEVNRKRKDEREYTCVYVGRDCLGRGKMKRRERKRESERERERERKREREREGGREKGTDEVLGSTSNQVLWILFRHFSKNIFFRKHQDISACLARANIWSFLSSIFFFSLSPSHCLPHILFTPFSLCPFHTIYLSLLPHLHLSFLLSFTKLFTYP
jgi:hypothetical protein